MHKWVILAEGDRKNANLPPEDKTTPHENAAGQN